ncbi:Uncharacterised protein [Actinomyces bovis]|uniref:Uncharacterized protein n=1 Tax=Actinomyces bovis TaxID=1658 RepID=A0ABY1VT16_9ACTO|nr:hypothetical protein [Actinomyces bovis]SPT54178.1 Uncharacterised protein [Actinomyces bovis]VEG53536.1 Uncharacterised protein [Actinomyces israelii]
MSKKKRAYRGGNVPVTLPRPATPVQAPPAEVPPVPTPPRDPAATLLTDHSSALAELGETPLEEQAELLRNLREELARTLREAED